MDHPDKLSFHEPEDRLINTRVGQYRMKRIIAAGGMGTVYEALQEHPERTVAVKVMKHGLASTSARLRFEHEAQILAKLEHPHIAQVIEGGVHRDLSFMVMEYIEGARPITAYARDKELTLEQRLNLFLQVLDAVEHGHRKGIIHRDLKPDNLLVDQEGWVKVIDFGVARAVETDDAIFTGKTELSTITGTFQYMAPEQCTGTLEDLDMRSDLYSLGVVLYELLCLDKPYEVQKTALLEAVRIITEEPPKRPSLIRPGLEGDLETLLLKTLEKEKSRRYQSVKELAEDIRRFLKGEVLEARPVGPFVRCLKFVKRKPAMSAAMGTAAAALILFLVSNLWYLMSLLEERSLAFAAEERAMNGWREARHQADLAKAHLEELNRLSDMKLLSQLNDQATNLWPPYPEKIEEMTGWLAEAEDLVQRLPLHGATRKAWSRGERDSWAFEVLDELIKDLEAFRDPKKGTYPQVKERLAFAETIYEESVEKHIDLWAQAIRSIECPLYHGLRIRPQVGLVPLGKDPVSNLWEFVLLQTGGIPERGPDNRLIITEDTGLVMVLIPGGRYMMGAAPPDEGQALNRDPYANVWEGPVHPEEIPPFLLSKYEMTQAQWQRITGSNPSVFGPGTSCGSREHTLLHPVESVSCVRVERILFRLKLRLPTGPEWEYAARGGTSTIWWTGNERRSLDGAANLKDSNFKYLTRDISGQVERWLDDGYGVHAPVGSYRANPFGLHDTCGNVWEWCTFREYMESSPLDEPAFDFGSTPYRGVRGGSCEMNAVFCRSAYRNMVDPFYNSWDYGVRPAMTLELNP